MRSLTKSDKARAVKLFDIGCIVCLEFGDETPAGIHHIDGQTKPSCHKLTIPLCANHHQIPSIDNLWTSRHGDGKRAFEEAYGREIDLLKIVNKLINEG